MPPVAVDIIFTFFALSPGRHEWQFEHSGLLPKTSQTLQQSIKSPLCHFLRPPYCPRLSAMHASRGPANEQEVMICT